MKATGSSLSSSDSRMVVVPVPISPTGVKEFSGSMDDTSRVGHISSGSSVTSSDSRDGSRGVAKDCLGGGGGLAGLTQTFGRGSNVVRRSIAKAGIAKT